MADFDPSKSFDVVNDGSQTTQDFDPSKPFDITAEPSGQNVRGTDEWYAKQHPVVSTIAETLMNKQGPSGGPGMWTRAGQAVGLPTTREEAEASKPQLTLGGVAEAAGGPAVQAGKMVYGQGKQMVQGAKTGAEEVRQAGENIKAGQPIWPNVGKAAYGMAHSMLQSIPFVGAPIETMGEDVTAGNYRGAVGGGLAVVPQIMGAMEGHATGEPKVAPTEVKPTTNIQRLGEKIIGKLPEKLQPQGVENINRLEARLDKAIKEGKGPIADYNAHAASHAIGEHAPEEVIKKAETAKTKITEAQKHLRIAREAQQGVQPAPAPEMALSPEQKLDQDTRQTAPPTNEELGTRQEKLMGDIESKAPAYPEGTAPLPPEERMGAKPEPEVPAKPEASPIMTAGKPERVPSMAGLKVSPEGKVEDTTATQTAAREALGVERSGRMVPATEGVAVPPMRGEIPEYTETGKRLGIPPAVTEDIGAKVRGAAPEMPRGERRVATRTPEEEQTTRLFKQARTELGENATSDQVMSRVDELKAAEQPNAEASKKAQNTAETTEELARKKRAEQEAAAQKTTERTPEDLSKVDRAVFQLTNQELLRLGNRFGMKEADYDFSKREGVNRHAVEREQFSKDLQANIPEALRNHIADVTNAWDAKDKNVFGDQDMSSTFGAERSRAIINEALKRYTDELAAKGHGGGAPADVSAQIAAHNANGGSTFHPEHGDLNGKPFFSVGGEPEFKNPELKMTVDGGELTADQLKEFTDRPAVKEALAKNPDASVGTWHDKEAGNTVIELVKTPADRDEAIKMGVRNEEKSIYDLKEGKEIKTGGERNLPAGYPKTDEEAAAKITKEGGVGGGAPGKATKAKPLPTGDDLIKKYGESDGDPAHTTFILKDGRGVANTGTDHDMMLGGKATDKNPPREQFVGAGNIRVRARSIGVNSRERETSFSIPDTGINAEQLAYMQKMSPMLRSGAVLIEGSKAGSAYRVLKYNEATPEALEKATNEVADRSNR